MVFNTTNVFSRIIQAITDKKRLISLQGGTSSSKTYSTLQILATIGMYNKNPLLISTVSESLPHLKRGCIRDFRAIMGDYWQDSRFSKTEKIYDFGKVQMEFFGADDESKCRGPRRDILYINECNNVNKMAFDQLETRTRKFCIVDYNPVEEFYIHSWHNRPDVAFIKSTYLDAKHVLPIETIKSIESRRETDPNWWNVYGLGEVGSVEDRVFHNFEIVNSFPENKEVFYGQDWGYSKDVSALVQCCIIGKDLFVRERMYEKGLLNNQIAAKYNEYGIKKHYDEIFADGARPEIIDDIYSYGYNIKRAPKGPESIINGINKLKEYNIKIDKSSTNLIKEIRGYRYITDKNGVITNKPIDYDNHLIDAMRYALAGYLDRSIVSTENLDWI